MQYDLGKTEGEDFWRLKVSSDSRILYGSELILFIDIVLLGSECKNEKFCALMKNSSKNCDIAKMRLSVQNRMKSVNNVGAMNGLAHDDGISELLKVEPVGRSWNAGASLFLI